MMWWPLSRKYPERRAEEVDAHEYDYIVVGGSLVSHILPFKADM